MAFAQRLKPKIANGMPPNMGATPMSTAGSSDV